MNISRFTLGTAQLGLDYGIANINGKPDIVKALEILNAAVGCGVTSFDTSYSYGESEEILGSFIAKRAGKGEGLSIISKLPKILLGVSPAPQIVYKEVKKYVTESIKRLNVDTISVYLMHDASDICSYEGNVLKSLTKIREEGLIGTVGASFYYPDDAERVLDVDDIGAVQVPVNLMDHRFIRNGLMSRLSRKGKIVFARSVFLQGLFFMDHEELSEKMCHVKPYLRKAVSLAGEHNLGMDELAMGFVNSIPGISSFVIGADNATQVLRNSELIDNPPMDSQLYGKISGHFAYVPEKVTIPIFWGKE
ncbi:MAG: aldo/keto reductase [Candidatus Omnitrophota bacterium]